MKRIINPAASLLILFLYVLLISTCHTKKVQVDAITEISETDTLNYHRFRTALETYYDTANVYGPEAVFIDSMIYYYPASWDTLQNDDYAYLHHLKGWTYFQLKDYATSASAAQRAIHIRKQILPFDDDAELGNSYYNYAVSLQNLGLYEEAIQSYESALKTQLGKKAPSRSAEILDNIGIFSRKLGNLDKAIKSHEQALTRLTEIDSLYTSDTLLYANIHTNLGKCYEREGDQDRSILHYERGINIRKKILSPPHRLLANSMENIALHASTAGQHERAISSMHKVLTMRQELNSPDTITALSNLCFCYFMAGQLIKAKAYCEQGLTACRISTPRNWIKEGYFLDNLADIYLIQSDYYTQAEISANSGLVAYGQAGHPDAYLQVSLTYHLGYALLKQGKLKESNAIFKRALKLLNYNPEHLETSNSISILIQVLTAQAELQLAYHEQTQSKPYLYASRKILQQALAVADYYRQGVLLQHRSEELFSGFVLNAYEQTIRTASLLYQQTDSIQYLSEVFQSMEMAKSQSLMIAFQQTESDQLPNLIPDSLLENDQRLKQQITSLQRKMYVSSSDTFQPDATYSNMQKELFELQAARTKLLTGIRAHYPDYYEFRYVPSLLALTDVQQQLPPTQTILSYFVGESNTYLLLIQHKAIKLHEISMSKTCLKDSINELTEKGIQDFGIPYLSSNREQSINSLVSAGTHLYDQLIRPVQKQLTEHLIIIPDGPLNKLPFEVLLSTEPERPDRYASFPYLLKNHTISYAYSATVLRKMQQTTLQTNANHKEVLVIAPFSGQNRYKENSVPLFRNDILSTDTLTPLPGSLGEIDNISQVLDADLLLNEEATLTNFRQMALNYRILHFSTHAKANYQNGNFSYLALRDNIKPNRYTKLFAKDLYGFELNAEMVFLSACETGVGHLHKGEGLISLARAFAYAGSKSMIASLWPVQDQSTAELTGIFYHYLTDAKRYSKDDALRQAKLDFIKNNKGKGLMTHPYYWSGIIAIGDMQSLSF